MINRTFILSFLFACLTAFAGLCYGAENPYQQELIKSIFEDFAVKHFEQMLHTGKYDLKFKAVKGASLLHYAAIRGDIKLVQELVSQGADVNEKTRFGETVLHCAAFSGNQELVK